MNFSVTPLGSSAAVPLHGRNLSACFVQVGPTSLLLDCGEGTQHQLIRHNLPLIKLDAIFITHLHGDHLLGLPGLLSSMALWSRKQPLSIFAPAGVAEWLTAFLRISESSFPFLVEVGVLENSSFQQVWENKTVKVSAFPLKHRIATWGFQVEEQPAQRTVLPEELPSGLPYSLIPLLKKGKDVAFEGKTIFAEKVTLPPRQSRKFAYCSDTAFASGLYAGLKSPDLLYHEATFAANELERAIKTGHSTSAQAAQAANLCKAKRLLIGHFSSRYSRSEPLVAEAKTIFEATEAVEEGKEYQL